ncbi:hypothetical protein L2E82_24500 [Cichorium intybus]|uniref:Uncharacterized protein n=1 Tax=Cichorium intybus TaxID=13427 RepID=A0ACB9E111_CICIN|nr:hypothetical protein L2E82_24500 [Cichorium intybus]
MKSVHQIGLEDAKLRAMKAWVLKSGGGKDKHSGDGGQSMAYRGSFKFDPPNKPFVGFPNQIPQFHVRALILMVLLNWMYCK